MHWRDTSLVLLAGRMRGWFARVDRADLNREWNLRLEERRRERARIARELHDRLLQGILGASMQLHAAHDQLQEDSPLKPTLRRALELMEKGIADSHAALEELRSPEIGSSSLEQLLSLLADEVVSRDNARLRITVIGQPQALEPKLVEQIFLIAREAIFNALRHSGAASIEIELEYSTRKLRVVVRDNGSGFDARLLGSSRQPNWGLLGMRERSAMVGARLRLWSKPGAGTEVEISLPLNKASQPSVKK